MHRPPMLSILFHLRYNKKNLKSKIATVYCQLTLAGQKATAFSTGVKTEIADWKPKAKSTGDVMKDKKLMIIENRLSALHLKYELDGQPYTIHELRAEFLIPKKLKPVSKPITYLEMYGRFVKSKEGEVADSSLAVIERYATNTAHALTALGLPKLLIGDMDGQIMESLKRQMLTTHAESSTLKMLVYAKAVMDFAVLEKVLLYNPIKPYKIGKPETKDPVYLTIDEERRLLETDISQIPGMQGMAARLNKARDIYIVLRELGFHYGDYLRFRLDETMITKKDGVWVYHAKRKKTKADIYNIVSENLAKVLDKYGGVCNLPHLANQRFNDSLKLLFAACGIDKNGSSKIARKTFSDWHTNEEPAPDPALCAMLGLKSTTYLKHYRKVDHRALIKHFKPVPDK
jgi:integrase